MVIIMATQTFHIDCGYDLRYDDFDQYDLWYDHAERVVMILIKVELEVEALS